MYHAPDGSAYLSGDALTVADILAADLTIDGAYAQLPPDMRHERDDRLDELLPWRPRAAVLREMHRRRAGEIVARRPCPTCTEGLVPELLTLVEHPSDPARTVTLLDAVVDLAAGMFEVAAGRHSLAAIVDQFCDSAARQLSDSAAGRLTCSMESGSLASSDPSIPADHGGCNWGDGVPAFAITVLGMLAAWSYEAGMARDTEPAITEAWAQALHELSASSASEALQSEELVELAALDPRVVAAETHVPERWAGCDWGAMVQTRDEVPTLSELRVEQGVSEEAMALCVLSVANWLAAESSRALTG
jgi:hypothetical protein